jgi:carbonic anhydrase/acetyltransferase-like protein (isoleucine patch superfamily)
MAFDQVLQRLDQFLVANPVIASGVYVAPNATLLGSVSIGSGSSVWFQSVIRADINEIRIGSETNIQDGSILHVADRYGLAIGNQVSCGHRAILHACTIHDRVLVGMSAVIMDGVEVGAGSIVGAGALLTKGTSVPPGSLVLGSPGKVVRLLTASEQKSIEELAAKYVSVGKYYLERKSGVAGVQELRNGMATSQSADG